MYNKREKPDRMEEATTIGPAGIHGQGAAK